MANLITWDPFREFDEVQDQMNRLFSRSLAGTASQVGLPATDIYEEDGKLTIETALPLFNDDEVEVQIDGDRLEIKAEHKTENEQPDRNYLRRESQATSYYRQFALPKDVAADSADAHFENGVLRVTLDRQELPQPKKLALGKGKSRPKLEKSKQVIN